MSSPLVIYQEQVRSGIVHGRLRQGHSPEVILTLLCYNASCLQPHILSSSQQFPVIYQHHQFLSSHLLCVF